MVASFVALLQNNIAQAVLGKPEAIERTVITLAAGGHLLIEDRPGVGKTLLATALARSLGLPFQRLQCTSDLLPADILGAEVYKPATGELTFRQGPVFTSVLVADELNRTPPRTQSALLQCMAEGRVTVDRQTHELPNPFFVIATQNPAWTAGTYPLPESQLDRFLMKISIGTPEPEIERAIVARGDGHRALDELESIGGSDDVIALRDAARAVRVEPDLDAYIVELARFTRTSADARSGGVSTRGAQALHRACQARAVIRDRDYVVPDDVQALVGPVFGHRIGAAGGGDDGVAAAVLHEMLSTVGAPD